MSEAATPAATPAKENGGTPPTPPAATPANPQAEKVTLTKEEHDQLQRDAARARQNQRKADLYDRTVGSGKKGHFSPESQTPATPPSKEELEERAAEEDRKAEKGIIRLAVDPKYRDLLDADPTLRGMMTNNPLAVLPLFANDALDAEDAIALVTEELDKRLATFKKPATDGGGNPPKDEKKPQDTTPPAGAPNPSGTVPDEEYEAAKKNPNTERAVAGMIKVGLKKLGGSKQ